MSLVLQVFDQKYWKILNSELMMALEDITKMTENHPEGNLSKPSSIKPSNSCSDICLKTKNVGAVNVL